MNHLQPPRNGYPRNNQSVSRASYFISAEDPWREEGTSRVAGQVCSRHSASCLLGERTHLASAIKTKRSHQKHPRQSQSG